jgi:hypothetical protein
LLFKHQFKVPISAPTTLPLILCERENERVYGGGRREEEEE